MTEPDLARRRQHWMAVLAAAPLAAIEARLAEAPALPPHTRLRGPETGLVMVQGRAGGEGAPFNLGEMTVTRCSIRNESGAVGHAYLAGRDHRHAEIAAAVDAALQDDTLHAAWAEAVIAPLAAAAEQARHAVAAEAAATKVDFFTLATMRS